MAVQGDGADKQHELVAVGEGLPANSDSMCIAIHGRIESDLDRLAGIATLVRYSGTPTAHVLVVDTDGTSLKLLSNYATTATDVVETLAVGTGYTMFVEGSGSTLTLSLIVEGDTTILSEATTQTAFIPERLYLFGTNSSGTNESADATIRWCRIWDTTLTDTEKRAEHVATTAQKSGAITDRPFTGGNLGTALSAGSGAAFSVGDEGISYVEWESGPAPKVVTLTIVADVDLQGGTVPDPGTAPDITTTSLPAGQVGVPYSAQIVVTGTQPISIGASGLPEGIPINPDGSLSGTPAGSGGIGGTYTVAVSAENEYGSDTASLSLVIADAGVAPPVITTQILPDGTVGTLYEFTFTAEGAGPFSWSFSGLPLGIVASGPTISGQPQLTGIALISATVTGAGGASVTRQFELRINAPASVSKVASAWAAVLRR